MLNHRAQFPFRQQDHALMQYESALIFYDLFIYVDMSKIHSCSL